MSTHWKITGGTVLDPTTGTSERRDLFIINGVITTPPPTLPEDTREIDAHGLYVTPGLIDVHVHFREPGNEQAETVQTGSRAAAKGGFTTVVTMPNTQPPIDTPQQVYKQRALGEEAGLVTLLPSACITRKRAGKTITDMAALAEAGAVAFTDDGSTPTDMTVWRKIAGCASALGIPVMDHAVDPQIAGNGVLHAGQRAEELGFPGIPAEAEITAIARDIELARESGCAMHIQHISAGDAVQLIRDAQKQGIQVTGEATPHHLALTDMDIPGNDANYKMNPPLRSTRDRELLLEGVCDGTLEILATDHAPHDLQSKQRGFTGGPFGVVGLETAVGVSYRVLVRSRLLSDIEWLRRWTAAPAALLGLPSPSLTPGHKADICILDPAADWTIDPNTFVSKSKNSPFNGYAAACAVRATLHGGCLTWDARPDQ